MALRRREATRTEVEDRGDVPSDRSSDEPQIIHEFAGTGVTGVMIGMSVLAVLLVVFLAQNTDSVPIEFVTWDGESPLFVVVLVAVVASALATLTVSGIWRRRRRQHRTEHAELERLRRSRS